MADKTLISRYDGTMVRVGQRYVRVDRGGVVPENADSDHVKLLLDRKMVEKGETPGGVVADVGPAPFQVPQGSGGGDTGGAPAKSANKDAWVEFAVSQGASQEDAEAATKGDLIAQYGG